MLWTWTARTGNSPAPPPPGVRSPPLPCTALDLANFTLILTTGLIVDARLDVRKLEDTITVLVKRKFPRAGARIALRNGVYEFQVPEEFGGDMPAVRFTAEHHVEAYRSDASRPQLPMDMPGLSTSSPTISKVPDLDEYFRSPGPTTIKDWIECKSPLLHIHVCVFEDLTFIGVTSPHAGFDVGTGILLDAWTRLINGADLDEIAGMNWDSEPFKRFAPVHSPLAVPKLVPRGLFDLPLFSQIRWVTQKLWNEFWDPEDVHVFVRVPKAFLADWKCQIMDQLKREGSTEWVGSSDILLAWWYKETLGHRANNETPMHIFIVANVRNKPIFSNLSDSESIKQYICNAVSFIPVPPFPTSTFNSESVGQLALRLRRAINAYNANPAGI
ncbi:hypothetical protein FB45DRAFT_1138076 [Roridomyces roridus]|uniref:Uncharacterized protein n=1 Tax=Roridomyces roridus TaxID=1738132 RepID=A0AAD7FS74_9AGAR|nr:hypothetical protein FB45DRAFT_1138076 [Roridomyces roridus]